MRLPMATIRRATGVAMVVTVFSVIANLVLPVEVTGADMASAPVIMTDQGHGSKMAARD